MSHLHGGQFDPNAGGNHQTYQLPVTHQAHGGAYTPGSSVISYQNQPFNQHPQVSPHNQSPLSSHSTPYQATPPPQGHQQFAPPGQAYSHPTMAQHNPQSMQGTYPQATGTGSPPPDWKEKGPILPITSTVSLVQNNSAQQEKEFPIVLKGSRHCFEPKTVWRWWNPMMYQKPAFVFTDTRPHRHRDYAGRVALKPNSDRYLHHNDGYLRNLYVACSDEIYEAQGTSTWKRTYVQKVASVKVRLATWVIDFNYDPESHQDWLIMLARALPAALAMNFVFWDGKPTVIKRSLAYAPILYAYHGDAKVWSNLLENRKGVSLMARNNQIYRLLRPRYLCFLREPLSDQNKGVNIRSVAEWETNEGSDAPLSYLFVAYSTEHFSHGSEQDMMALHDIAETACRAAKLSAYWVACSCMRDKSELEADVYRISDVLRGAQDMIIAVGRGKSSESSGKSTTDTLLKEWGSRMWTFPEVLLSPGQNIRVYTRGGNLRAPMIVPKNQFPSHVWTFMGPDVSRHLVDHYLGSITLSRLELSVLALKCLYSRHTTQYLSGDQAYALMGLLRMRPQIDHTDTAFQAFSRLSLANDSDTLLERYICTLPVKQDQPWYDMTDAYESALWDISPYCQVAGIADNDTIIIDGAWGMSVRWKSFYPVYWSTGPSWKRFFSALAVEWNGGIFIAATALLGSGASYGAYGTGMIGAGVLFLLLFLYIWLMTPKLVRVIYGGKFAETQAEMFGFEGYLNAPTIERAIFGGNFGRFSWSPNGSPLSRSVVNEFGERVGIDPSKDPEIRIKVEEAKRARPGDTRVFTLVDTYNMQLTLFEAVRPPTTMMFCASEGGMQRAIGCSYDWTSQTFYRETVLRLATTSLNRMDRVPRFRMGIQRPSNPSVPRTAG
ncbi:Fc.00g002560.m01.CDS01 [Cosmosporella sp. VM-42]